MTTAERELKEKHESAMNTHFVCLKPWDVQIYVRTEVDPLLLQSHITQSGVVLKPAFNRKDMNAEKSKGVRYLPSKSQVTGVSSRVILTYIKLLKDER
jgi:hypothetical protein